MAENKLFVTLLCANWIYNNKDNDITNRLGIAIRQAGRVQRTVQPGNTTQTCRAWW